ncbi:alpha/beta hydrolase [Sphingomonas sp. QA11]|uniref:alpha/beta hydrolase n=1 Tax=Sphingomonas sp. QA11 TaxID=2950605 RepID=UPI002349EF55|nr:alpha/beta hydrolase [Sphingomonas sp. QA11]WCM29644.1 alpha/beta hydrolase [Sphingomonas sp. QA11]
MSNAKKHLRRIGLAVALFCATELPFQAIALPARPQAARTQVKNIILVHGAWADGSSWSRLIPLLLAKGYNVTAVQLPLTSLADDAATVKRAIALADGSVILVGHSYGGAVITEAGNDPKVVGLVYVAAFAPDAGQSAGSLSASAPPPPMGSEARPDAEGFLKLTRTGVFDDFAQDVSPALKAQLFAAQAPTNVKSLGGNITVAAWRTRPSWYVVASNDRAIQPSLEAAMAKKIKATTTTIAASHVAMLSHPAEVAAVVEKAAAGAN